MISERWTDPLATRIATAMVNWPDSALDAWTIEYTKVLVLSCLGAVIGGSAMPAGRIASEAYVPDTRKGPCTVAGTNRRAALEDAAWANALFAHATEYEDDSFPEAVSTFTVIPPLLAVAEDRHISGHEVLRSVVAAHEVQSCLAKVCMDGFDRGFQLLPIMGTVATAAAAAQMLQMSIAEIANAINISASQAAGLRVQTRSMTHFLESGAAARAGLMSAVLAGHGFDAEPCALEGRQVWRAGLMQAIGAGDGSEESSIEGFLEPPYEISRVSIKAWPMCMLIQPIVEAIALIKEATPFDPASVLETTVTASSSVLGACDVPDPTSPAQALFSLQHVAASAIRFGRELSLNNFLDDAIVDGKTSRLRDAVRFVSKDDWPDEYMGSPLAVSIELMSGQRVSRQVVDVHGMPPRYMSWGDVRLKFDRATGQVLSAEQRDHVATLVQKLDDLDDAADLARSLAVIS
jgi:2-methylcitrate dehydratase